MFGMLVASQAVSAASIVARVDAQISNPGFIVVDNTVTGLPLGVPDGEASRSAASSFGGPSLIVESHVRSQLSLNAIAIEGEWSGQSALGVGSLRNARAGGQIDFNDQIDVLSTLLPDGTPVQITFSFHAAQIVQAFHTSGASTSNNSGIEYQFSGQIVNLESFANTLTIPITQHRRQLDFGMLGPQGGIGLLDPANGHVDFLFDTFVGERIDLSFRLRAVIAGSVVSTGVGEILQQTGLGRGAVAIAFGASPLSAAVELESMIFSGEYPASAAASLANASAALTTIVPLPSAGALMALCVVLLIRRTRAVGGLRAPLATRG